MPSLKDIRNRVRSVKNTQKITRAMKLVAAAKLRRAQDAVIASRPYAAKMRDAIAELVAGADPEANALFRQHENPSRALLVPFTADRGLCGGFNASLIKRSEVFVRDQSQAYDEIGVSPVGSKGTSYFGRTTIPSWMDTRALVVPGDAEASAEALTEELVRLFLAEEIDEVYLVFNEFKSALTQEVVVQQLLPLSPETFASDETALAENSGETGSVSQEPIYEPDELRVLDALLPRYLESQVLRAILESTASEMGARMTAMDNATNNAKDLIDSLTLQMNRARQAAITTELMEITSGSEALKG